MSAHRPLVQEVCALRGQGVKDLRARYEALAGRATASRNARWLRRAIADLLVAGAGPLDPKARRAVTRALREAAATPPPRSLAPRDPRLPTVGTVLRRRHAGRPVEVRVLRDGFRYEGRVYGSLSAVAMAVTRCHWNGRLFFGLVRRRRARAP